jgi:hypothetical protein
VNTESLLDRESPAYSDIAGDGGGVFEQTCPTHRTGMFVLELRDDVKRYRPLARKGRAAYREELGSQSFFCSAASFLSATSLHTSAHERTVSSLASSEGDCCEKTSTRPVIRDLTPDTLSCSRRSSARNTDI